MRRVTSVLAALLLALPVTSAVVVATGVPAAAEISVDEVAVRPADGVFKLEGHGWGHGRGLNQWGSQGAARAGKAYTEILAAYYPGTELTTLADAPIRALLEYDDEVDVQVRSATGLAARDLATGTVYVLPSAPSRWRITVDPVGLHLEHLTASTWTRWTATDMKTTWAGPLQFEGASPIRVYFADGSARDFRGTIRGVRTSSTALQTVNSVGLEDYLRGVVPRESPASFHAEALKAQSVAARSYSAYKRAHVPSGSQADICSTTQCQVYGGMRIVAANGTTTELEAASTSAAIDATRGQVRTVDGAPIFAEFSASNGGHSTAHAVFTYLAANPDPWDALASPHHYWTATVTAAEIEAKYPSVGRLARVRVLTRDGNGEWGGRVRRVVLEGTSSSGAATSVESTGGGIYSANPWAGGSDTGIRGSWWRFRSTTYDAGIVSQSAVPTLVRPPGVATKTVTVVLENRGGLAWPVADLHLALTLPPGSADPLVDGSTRPGVFARNITRPGASEVSPNEHAEFTIAFDASDAQVGTVAPSYRLRIGSGALFGPNIAFTVVVADPVLSALRTAISGTPASGEAPPPVASNGTVVLPRSGAVALTVKVRNTGNVAWPVGGPVKLGGSGPRNRTSPSAGAEWPHPTRAAVLSGADGVANARTVEPGQVGLFSFTLHGNDHPAGYATREVFEPLWEGVRWIGGGAVILYVVRVDPSVPRLAETAAPMPGEVSVGNHPGASTTVAVRMRNLGGAAWPVGGEALVTTPAGRTSPLRAPSWPAADRAAVLGRNVSRPGVSAVHPGEVGEWLLTFSGAKQKPATYVETFQLASSSTSRYGPVLATNVVVRGSILSGTLRRVVSSALVVPAGGSATAYVDVTNTGNVDWPVAGMTRLAVPSGTTSASRDGSWLAPTRPTAISANLTRAGAAEVRPGETARFEFRLAGNGRASARYTEKFAALWEGWRWLGISATVSYTVR